MMATTAKYVRLSSEDDDLRQGGKLESNSIANQRDLLDAFISRMPELAGTNIIEFCDDGWSGKNFERPAVQEMIAQARAGKIQCIVVKDLSRFGRDYLTVGSYISSVFPFLGVRFIAVNDGYDSIRPMDVDSLDTSFKTLLYDFYSRDLSRKVRKAKRFRAQRGDFLSPFAPYGYIKDPEDKNHLLIDPPAAETVRRIFRMMGSGHPAEQIAKRLNSEAVPTPMLYKRAAGCSRTSWPSVQEENIWTRNAIGKILRDERYIGTNVYGKRMRDQVGHHHMKGRSGALRWLYQHEMEYHFKRAVFDTLRLLQMLTHDTDFANSGNLADICERGHTAFNNILDGNMDGFDLEKE